MKSNRSLLTALTCLGAFLMLVVGSGCTSKPKSGSSGEGDYVAMFNQGRFSEAYDVASREAGAKRGRNRDTAALIAGQSAYRLGRANDASRWLEPLIENSDPAIAGRANATLGSIATSRGTYGTAAEYFLRASTRLTGDDAARSLMHAGDAKKTLKQDQEARVLWERARDKVDSDAQLRVAIGDRLAGGFTGITAPIGAGGSAGQFTVQAGAFATRAKADQAASGLRGRPDVRIVMIKDRAGRSLHAVRVGRYATKGEAEAVARSMPRGAYVTTTSGE